MALHQEVVIVHPLGAAADSDDNGEPQYNSLTDITLVNCQVGPLAVRAAAVPGEEEPSSERLVVSTEVGDMHPEIEKEWGVTWRGNEYIVLGFPRNMWAVRPHTEFTITRSEG